MIYNVILKLKYVKISLLNLQITDNQKEYYKKMENICLECLKYTPHKEINYSINKYGIPLCFNCQKWVEDISYITTQQTIALYFDLKGRGLEPQIEKYDGYKHIDIAIPQARINIEIDGAHHNTNSNQALSDLKRTFYSLMKGYTTIRIPNSLINNKPARYETANILADLIYKLLNDRNRGY